MSGDPCPIVITCPRCGMQMSEVTLMCPRCREPLSLGCDGDCSSCHAKTEA